MRVVTVVIIIGIVIGLLLALVYVTTGNLYVEDFTERLGDDYEDMNINRPKKVSELERQMTRVQEGGIDGISKELISYRKEGNEDLAEAIGVMNDEYGLEIDRIDEFKEEVEVLDTLEGENTGRMGREIAQLKEDVKVIQDKYLESVENIEGDVSKEQIHKDVNSLVESYITALEEIEIALEEEDLKSVKKNAERASELGAELGM